MANSVIPRELLYLQKPLSPGKISVENPVKNIRTFAAGAAGIGFGLGVVQASVDANLVIPANSASATFVGVTREAVDTHETDYTTPAYASGTAVGVLDQGVITVQVTETIAVGNPVRVVITATGTSVPGQFCTAAITSKTALVASGITYRSASASGVNMTGLVADVFVFPPFVLVAD